MIGLLKTNIWSCIIVFVQELFSNICLLYVILFDMQDFFLISTQLFPVCYHHFNHYVALLILNCHYISTFILYIYIDNLKVLIKLFQSYFDLNIKISSQSHSIYDCSKLSTCLLLQLLLNLFLLSAKSIVFSKLKQQLLTLLIKVFEYRVDDIKEFLPIIDTKHIHCSVALYKRYVESYETTMNRIWYYCRLFVCL